MEQNISVLPQVVKRDGNVEAFDKQKIASALLRAGRATGEFDSEAAQTLTARVIEQPLASRAGGSPGIEQIQDAVEAALFEAGYRDTLRAYIVYREQHKKLRSDRKTLVDVESSINEYLQQLD